MKKSIKYLSLLLILFSLIAISCSKDDDDPANQSAKTTKEYLTAGNWKTTAMTISPGISFGGVTITDFFAQFPACTKDDLVLFNSNGTITDDEGPTKCDPNDPQTTTEGSWSLNSDNTILTITYPGEPAMSLTISTINDTTLTGTYTLVEDLGNGLLTYTISVTMVRV